MKLDVLDAVVTLHRADGTPQTQKRTMLRSDAQWVADQFADVNQCGVVITCGDEEVATAGNV